MDMLKAKINSNIAHKPKKELPMDKLQTRQNEFLLQLQAIYALHCSFAILFFLSFLCQSLSSLSLSLSFPSLSLPKHLDDAVFRSRTPLFQISNWTTRKLIKSHAPPPETTQVLATSKWNCPFGGENACV